VATGSGGWSIYHDPQAGFTLEFPEHWAVTQRDDEGGTLTVFAPPDGAGVSVATQPGNPPSVRQPEKSDLVCTRVTVGGLTGPRCVNSAAGTIATILSGKGRTYVIATAGPGVDEQVYEHVLGSFRPAA
jgi:hypothetical protein